jgi:hypothetical protein
MLTADRLKEIIHYDPATGVFTRDGKVAGGLNHDHGYWCITIDGIKYLGHRLAVLYMTGEWPRFGVSHRDLNRSNNAWTNLRSATKRQTARHRKASNQLGIKGVRMTPCGNFRANIYVNKRNLNLGTYATAEAASQAYADAALEHFGEFARPSIIPGEGTNFSKHCPDRSFSVPQDTQNIGI